MLVVLASILLVLAVVVGYARVAVFDADQFANRATASLQKKSVRDLAAQRITDQLVLKNESDLIAARPAIEAAAAAIVGGDAFASLFRPAVKDVHRAIFDRDQHTFTLTLADVGTVVASVLQRIDPAAAKKAEQNRDVVLVKRDIGSATSDLARVAERVRALAAILGGLTLLLMAAAIVISPDRRRTVTRLAMGALAGGVLIVIVYAVGRSILLSRVTGSDERDAAGAIFDTFASGLRTAGWIMAGAGAVVAAAASSLMKPMDVEHAVARAWGWVIREPETTPMKVMRAVLLIALGVWIVLEPSTVLQVVATLAGVYVVFKGVEAILRLVYQEPEERAAPVPKPKRRHRARRVAALAIVGVLIAGALGAFTTSDALNKAAPAIVGCNGSKALCGKPFDKVVLPATHNAMSVPLPGWYSAEQEHPIATQLADGIRGLLIDTHYADKLPNGKFRTEIKNEQDLQERIKEDGISPEALAAAKRLRERLGFEGSGKRGMYLCHSFCELGATPLESVLSDIHDFLVTRPDAVLLVINQDYVTPQDFVKAVEDAGLTQFVYKGPVSGRWPTLREMVRDNQRLVLLAENHAGGAPWYHPAYQSITEETPYEFKETAELTQSSQLPESCRPNRGPEHAPLFLINHWISTDPVPLPSNAATVNAYQPLLHRAEVCERLRHHLPNLLAVNFYKEGDLFKVVDKLNGVTKR